MAQESKEPCKKEACDIQACLSKNNFMSQSGEAKSYHARGKPPWLVVMLIRYTVADQNLCLICHFIAKSNFYVIPLYVIVIAFDVISSGLLIILVLSLSRRSSIGATPPPPARPTPTTQHGRYAPAQDY